jgi:hypothetical protein
MADETQNGSQELPAGVASAQNPSPAPSRKKRTYSAPQLKRLGSVAELTFGSAHSVTERGGTKTVKTT